MLSNKQIRMLQLLDKQVGNCSKCELQVNGNLIPYWTPLSKYAIIGDSPVRNEIRQQTPLIGQSGKILTEQLMKVGFEAKDFLIINTVQCRPDSKPTEDKIISCQGNLRKYLKVVNPEKILCLGNYAKYIFTGNLEGILRERGEFKEFDLGGSKFPTLFSIHPSYCVYEPDGLKMLSDDIQLFKDIEFERESDWLFSEEDFRI